MSIAPGRHFESVVLSILLLTRSRKWKTKSIHHTSLENQITRMDLRCDTTSAGIVSELAPRRPQHINRYTEFKRFASTAISVRTRSDNVDFRLKITRVFNENAFYFHRLQTFERRPKTVTRWKREELSATVPCRITQLYSLNKSVRSSDKLPAPQYSFREKLVKYHFDKTVLFSRSTEHRLSNSSVIDTVRYNNGCEFFLYNIYYIIYSRASHKLFTHTLYINYYPNHTCYNTRMNHI